MSVIGPGTLKCVISGGEPEAVLAKLVERVGRENFRQFSSSAVLVYTPMEPSELRDWLAVDVGEGGTLLVVEFERWSGHGSGVDRAWLLERGH